MSSENNKETEYLSISSPFEGKFLTMSYCWAMPNKWTFKIKPISELLERYGVGYSWVDPFAGVSSPAALTNDHRDECGADFCMDAVDFSRDIVPSTGTFGVLFDPPYSIHEVKRHYDSLGRKYDFSSDPTCGFKPVKDILAPKIRVGGLVISFGWNSSGFGKVRGFKKIEILLVGHGGNRNDTIVTVEERIE